VAEFAIFYIGKKGDFWHPGAWSPCPLPLKSVYVSRSIAIPCPCVPACRPTWPFSLEWMGTVRVGVRVGLRVIGLGDPMKRPRGP